MKERWQRMPSDGGAGQSAQVEGVHRVVVAPLEFNVATRHVDDWVQSKQQQKNTNYQGVLIKPLRYGKKQAI